MAKLNDTQLVLLTTASQREDGSILPFPETLTSKPAQIRQAIRGLIKQNLINEVEVRALVPSWREEEDRRFGALINDAGRAAIGLRESSPSPETLSQIEAAPKPSEVRSGTKQSLLLDLIRRDEGASIDDIVAKTGWLAHTVRAAITGLRKRGHEIGLRKEEGGSRYHYTQAAAQ